jgi:hypothetical protein
MKRLLFAAAALFLLLVPAPAFSEDSDDLGRVRLSLINGDVQVLIKDSTDWTDAAINVPLGEGDRIWIPAEGKAEVQIRGGVYVRAGDTTSLDILTMNDNAAQFYLDRGHLYINNLRGGVRTVQIDTPFSSIRSDDNSILMIDASEGNVVEVSVLLGSASAENRTGATRVTAGNTLTIRGETDAELAPIGGPDEWERWNRERDSRVAAWGESTRYLPEELHEYASDFNGNGRWYYTPDYGYVWNPIVTDASWAPYTYGSWVWVRGNYVWIDYHPWGWAPSHYGRWTFIASFGWSWIPPPFGAAFWGPGYVGWVFTPTYVAWVPLAPGEIYYGYGNYGPHSVNIRTVNINTRPVTRTYVNARVRNSVTVVQRDSFGTGRRVPITVRENPFRDGAPRQPDNGREFVPPNRRPERPIVLVPREMREQIRQQPAQQRGQPERRERPAVKPSTPQRSSIRTERPASQLPPERVRRTSPETLKSERPVTRDRNTSVFKPAPPENLPVIQMKEPRKIIRKQEQERQSDRKRQDQSEQRRDRSRIR